MRTQAELILEFFDKLKPNWKLPKGIELLFPFENANTKAAMQSFYGKYYADNKSRKLVLGINPGRLGAGVTGIPFTDPIHLKDICKIDNEFKKKHELSSLYVYELINAMGGPKKFFGQIYISSVCPLGFTKGGINYNYYDDQKLYKAVKKHIVEHIARQLEFNISRDKVYCWGKGKNYKFLKALNEEFEWFDEIIPQPHPRWIMQYRRKHKTELLDKMLEELIV